MPKRKELSLDLRKKMAGAHLKGVGYTGFSTHFAVETAVCFVITKHKKTNSVINKADHGRKGKISKTLERKIFRDIKISAKILAGLPSSGLDVSRKTVVVGFQENGITHTAARQSQA